MKRGNPVWVWTEQRNNRLMEVGVELLGKGLELSERLNVKLETILIGNQTGKLADELMAYGADTVYMIEDPRLQTYQSDVYANVLADLIREHSPDILLIGATNIGMDLAPRVASKVETGLTAHCVDLCIDEDNGIPYLAQVVPGWGGNLMVKIVCPEKRPQMATVRPGVLEKPARNEARKGEIIKVTPDIKDGDFKVKTIEMVEEKALGIPIEEADTVVAGGWGLFSAGGFKPVEELAEVLGAAVGGTRPAVDKEWISDDQMIGQSGKTINPKLFISVGASGAMHFTTGFLRSKVIMAIDQNPDAPIFKVSDIGLVGDLREILPYLIEELKNVV